MLQVIGAGFGRTGTHSLGLALDKLGFGPCYNIIEATKIPHHIKLWNNAIDRKSVDWDFLYTEYRSTVEWPAVAFLPELTSHFPDAKVILTLLEAESWYESAIATIFDRLELSAHNPDPIKRDRGAMARRLILERTFEGKYDKNL
ncbi:MAG TPA: sulfotransferase [Anaerolineales bacterium]|nr:sulfotransferase [Anaerolineales bacterium]